MKAGASVRNAARWDARIARARSLASQHAAVREALTFYAGLAEQQRSLFTAARRAPDSASFAEAIDLDGARGAFPRILAWLQRHAPAPLAEAAGAMRDEGSAWADRLRASVSGSDEDGLASGGPEGGTAARQFVIDALVQPLAEAVASDRRDTLAATPPGAAITRCPICSGRPCLGVLTEEGQGAKRMLLCARCLTEWEFLRVLCWNCREDRFDALPVYTTETFPHVRIAACDSCRTYLKTVDLTKDGLAEPLVDDIASVSLDLWAGEQGYRRLSPNLLRTA